MTDIGKYLNIGGQTDETQNRPADCHIDDTYLYKDICRSMIVERDVKEMMRAVAGLGKGESLAGIEWQAAEDYLLKHGMDKDSVASLESFLTQ